MDWRASVDIDCEGTGPEFWSEPVNALINIAFGVAALAGAVSARRHGVNSAAVWGVIVLATLIGAGSLLFRTIAKAVCAGWPLRTPYIRHLLNAVMIGRFLQVLIRAGRPVGP